MKVTRRATIAAAASLALGATPACAQAPRRTASGLRILDGDLAAARASFQTRLVHYTPSPQQFQNEPSPSGVTEILYSSGELSLKAWFARPAGDAPVPAVVFAHGGFAFGAEDFEMARPYLDAGFAVITPMVRGENGMPGDFSMFFGEVDDVIAAGEYMRAQPNIDTQRIFVAGHSVGGTLSMLAAQTSPIFRASAAFSGSPDQVLFCEQFGDMTPFDRSIPAEYEVRSPLSYAASFKAPARLYYATREVYGSDTEWIARIAREAGKDVVAEEIRGDHFTAVPEAMGKSIAFFRAQT